MASRKVEWGSSTAFGTHTLASLASSATVGREGPAFDNSTLKYLDLMVSFFIKLQAGSPTGDKTIYFYAAGSEDGTNWTDNATGADASITLRVPTGLRLIGAQPCPDSGGLTYKCGPFYMSTAFPVMPRKVSVIVLNATGIAFTATEGDHTKQYSGAYETIA
jgi:hypothetical protein